MTALQITNFDVAGIPIDKDGYINISSEIQNVNICGFGISCGPVIFYGKKPIYIQTTVNNPDEWTPIYISNTGNYELFWEDYFEDGEPKEMKVQLTGLKVPAHAEFTFNYYITD